MEYFIYPPKVLLLTNFKHGPEDEECPVPEEVRDTLGEFHNDILLHCGQKFFQDPVFVDFHVILYHFLLNAVVVMVKLLDFCLSVFILLRQGFSKCKAVRLPSENMKSLEPLLFRLQGYRLFHLNNPL